MSTETEHAALAAELAGLTTSRLVDSLAVLLGSDDAVEPLRTRVHVEADRWAQVMLGDDDSAARNMTVRMLAVLYPGDAPLDPGRGWWRTPLGRVTARRLGHPSRLRVSFEVAGDMLGITRQGVSDLVNRGKLRRHPEGGVDVAAVRERLQHLTSTLSKGDHV